MSQRVRHDVPECLRKHGITRLESNLQEGQRVALDASLVVLLFGDELIERLEARRREAAGAPAE